MATARRLTMSMQTSDTQQWMEAFQTLTGIAAELGEKLPDLSVSSYAVDEVEEQASDDRSHDLMLKVFDILSKHNIPPHRAHAIVSEINDANIVFRDRI